MMPTITRSDDAESPRLADVSWGRRALRVISLALVLGIPGAGRAATVTLWPTTNATTGQVTNPANAYASDNAYANVSSNSSSEAVSGFASTDLGVITDVTVWVEYKTSAAPGNDTYQFDAAVDGATFNSSIVAAGTTNRPADVTASLSLGALTWTQVGTLAVRALTTRVGGADGYSVDWDAAWIVVTYSPPGTLTIGNAATGEAATTLAPGAGAVALDAFTLTASAAGAQPSSITVTMPAGSAALIGALSIQNTQGCNQATPYGTVTNPPSDVQAIPVSGLTVNTTATPLWVCLAPRSHASMPPPPGSQVAVTGQVTAVVASGFVQAGGDTVGAARTIDNLSPANVTGLGAAPGDAQATLSWTNPADADLAQVVILRNTASIGDTPTEGASYTAGNTIGTSTVAYVGTASPQTITGLTNGQLTYFRAFAKDTSGNYSQTGVETSATPVSSTPNVAIGNGSAEPTSQNLNQGQTLALDAFSLQATSGTAAVGQVVVSLTNGTALSALSIQSTSACSGGTTYGTLGAVANGNNTVPTTGLSATTTSGGTNLYVCATGGTVASPTAVAGTVASVTASGYTSTDGDTSSATLTVQVPAVPVTTVGDGTNPGGGTVAPGAAATALDAFTLQTSTGTDPVSSATVTLASGTWQGLSAVSIQNASGCNGTVFGTVAPSSSAVVIPLGGVTATTSVQNLWVCITPKPHAAMPLPPGSSYVVTGTVTAIASQNVKTYADAASATITVDNQSPANVTWGAITPASGQVTLGWTNPADPDFSQVVILRRTGGPVADAPSEGASYSAGNTIGASVVRYVGALQTFTDTGLTNGLAYYYRAFARDANGNYAVGVAAGPAFPGGNPLPVGDTSTNSTKPVVAIVNPGNGTVLSGTFRVQARVWSPAAAIGSVEITSNGGTSWTPLVKATEYGGDAVSGVWAGQLSLAAGSYTLVVHATNDGGVSFVNSVPVGVVVKAARTGDGKLLVRDNASQLCTDCHAMKAHSTEAMGTTYGSWATVCRDCHTPHGTTNVYLVPRQITPPALGAAVPTPKDVEFLSKNGFTNASNTGPCQVCHTRTLFYRADGTSPGGAHSTGDCSTCHKHTDGLKASCTTCHGDPNRVPAPGADTLVVAAPPVVSPTAVVFVPNGGAHLGHVNQATLRSAPLACAECHESPNTHQGTTDLAWGALATGGGTVAMTPPAGAVAAAWTTAPSCTNYCHGGGLAGGGGSVPSPSWDGPSTQAACGACHGTPPPVDATAANDHPQNPTCSSCHGTGYTQASLDAVAKTTHIDGTLQKPASGCTACHGALAGLAGAPAPNTDPTAAPGSTAGAVDTHGNTARTAVGVGAHVKHVNTGLMSGKSCSVCHGTLPAAGTTTHADGTVLASWSAPASAGGVTPTPASFTAAWEASPTCTNYCHSNAVPLGGTLSTVSVTWTSTTALGCTSCHGDAATGTLSARHAKHLAGGTYNMDCTRCHAATGSRTAITTPANHVDGARTLAFGLVGPVDQSGASYTGTGSVPNYTCNSSYCHSSGQLATFPFGAPARTTLNWLNGAANADCADCHGGNSSAGVVLASGSHTAHVNQAATYIGSNYGCVTCHANTVIADRTIATYANHANGTKDVTAASWSGTTCAANYCHSSGQASPTYYSVTWGTPIANDCKQCHGRFSGAGTFVSVAGEPNYANGGAGAPTANSHQKHVSAASDCDHCHTQTTNTGTAIAAGSTLHTNGTRDVTIAAAYDTNGGTSNYDPVAKRCNSVSCHGAATPQWGDTLGCTGCHGTSVPRTPVAGADANVDAAPPVDTTGASTGVKVGAHVPHVNQLTLRSSALVCADCHPSPNTHQGTRDAAWSALATNGGSVTPSPAAGAGAFSTTWEATPTCTNYCHGASLTSAGGTNKTPNWTGGSAQAACGTCHGAPPPVSAAAAEDHPQNGTCASCHGTGYATAGLTGSAKNTHIDRSTAAGVDKPASGCTACHGVLAGVSGAAVANTSMTAAPGYVGGTTGVDTKGNSSVTVASVGAHDAHVRPAGSLNAVSPLDCSNCHGAKPADGTTTHADATVGIGWSALATGGGAITPTPAAFSSAWEATPTCTNYCHSNAAPAGGGALSTPAFTWTSAANLTCSSCHATIGRDQTGGTTASLSQKHGRHLDPATYAFNCDECHAATVQNDSSSVIGTPANHVNGTKNVQFSTTLRTSTINQSGGSYASSTCSATYCHSGGVATAAPFSATASAALAWTTGTSTCRSCHGWDAAAAPTIGVAAGSSFQGSAKHANHVANATVIGTNYVCGDCHQNTVAAGTSSPITSAANHVNGIKDVSFAARNGQTSAPYASPNCNSNYCHSNGRDPAATDASRYANVAWNQAGTLDCTGCHGRGGATFGAPDYADGATLAEANSHGAHVSSATDCDHCHTQTTATGTAIKSGSTLHTNGARDVTIAAAFDSNGATANYASGTKQCSGITCHGASTPVWGDPSTATCLGCHGTTGTENEELGPNFWASNTAATINTTQWTYSGHGKTSGSYDVTGNPAANFPTTPTAGTSQCVYCHDAGVAHSVSTNPFRLRGASVSGGATGAWSTANPNAVCLNCHATGSFGVTPAGQTNKNGTIKPDAAHDGTKHALGSLGGKFCWDCHEPHGDRASNNTNPGENIAMIRAAVIAVSDGTYGYLGASGVTRNVTYNSQAASPPAVGKAVETTTAAGTQHIGLCQACHGDTSETNWTKYWNRLGYDDPNGPPNGDRVASVHNSTASGAGYCLSCHAHKDKFAGKGGGSDCWGCHSGGQGSTRALSADFTKQSHHVRTNAGAFPGSSVAGAGTNADCVVCHAEGQIVTSASADCPSGTFPTTCTNPTYHANGKIDLRDVDTIPNKDAAGTVFTYDKASISTTGMPGSWSSVGGATNWVAQNQILDSFCLNCHDSGGAAQISSFRLSTEASRTATDPFWDGSTNITNTYDGQSRGAPVNVKDMVVAGASDLDKSTEPRGQDGIADPPNGIYARHAIRGKSQSPYGTSGGIPAAYWVSGWNDTSVMSCGDCHTVDGANGANGNAHGSGSEYLLKDGSGGATEGNSPSTYVCARCHASANYVGGTHTGNTGDFADSTASTGLAGRVGTAKPYTTASIFGMACMNCHGGAPGNVGTSQTPTTPEPASAGFGRIHGTSSIFTNGAGGTRQAYRFMNGSSLRFYNPNGWNASNGGAITCYTLGTPDSWGSCTQHSGGRSWTKPVTRDLSY